MMCDNDMSEHKLARKTALRQRREHEASITLSITRVPAAESEMKTDNALSNTGSDAAFPLTVAEYRRHLTTSQA